MDNEHIGSPAWVLGASRGLGYASAQALRRRGHPITLSSRPGPRLDEAVARLAVEDGAAVDGLAVDLARPGAVTEALQALRERGGVPPVIVMSSGGPAPGAATEIGLDGLDAAYNSLLRPAYELVAGAAGDLRAAGGGVIVIVTSLGVLEPIPTLAASNIMRSGVTALMQSAAHELAPDGVRVLCVAPGRIATDRIAALDEAAAQRSGATPDEVRARSEATIPMRRYGHPEEFGSVVGFLCSPEASYVTGTTVLVDGGVVSGLLS
jgi:3-oxoacyl-[acyl-carrier protein] reductase